MKITRNREPNWFSNKQKLKLQTKKAFFFINRIIVCDKEIKINFSALVLSFPECYKANLNLESNYIQNIKATYTGLLIM